MNRTAWLLLFLAVMAVLGTYAWWANRVLVPPPGILVAEAPRQTPVAASSPSAASRAEASPMRHRGYRLTPVARFEAAARVLGLQPYRDDRHATLAPFDLAVGWGPMSDTAILDQYHIEQLQRVYRWRSDTDPLATREVIRHSTNIHVIPANATVAAALLRVRPGQVVRLAGRLVNVLSPDGERWQTSTSRTDAGLGACEILWLEALTFAKP